MHRDGPYGCITAATLVLAPCGLLRSGSGTLCMHSLSLNMGGQGALSDRGPHLARAISAYHPAALRHLLH